jgi:hypothetical protein
MSEFILNRDFNGSLKGDTVTVPNHLDGEMIRNRIGQKVTTTLYDGVKDVVFKVDGPKLVGVIENQKAIEVSPKNKAVLSTPKKKNVRRK